MCNKRVYNRRIIPEHKERNWSQAELDNAQKYLKIGSIVECRVCFGEDEEKKRGKLMKGEVTEKFSHHFLVKISTKRGGTWTESFRYIDLMPDAKGNAVVRVLKKGKK